MDGMVDRAAEDAVVVRVEETLVAVDAFAGATQCRTFAYAGIRVMAGGTAVFPMDLEVSGKGRGRSGVTAHAVGRGWGSGHVFLDPGGVVVLVAVEVRRMALGAAAALAAINGGVAIDANSAVAVDRVVARGAGGFMYCCDAVAGVADNTGIGC